MRIKVAPKLDPARLMFRADNTPYSTVYDDVYHSSAGGLEQARHVFLSGNRLPGRWQNRETFTIIETGFGLGLNFLATWETFRNDVQRSKQLHYVAVEKHPFCAADLAILHQRWPTLTSLSQQLIKEWPPLISGFHRLHFDNDEISLTLLLGDAIDLLPQLDAKADALFLDGFSPSKNADLWSPLLFQHLAKLSAPNATLATYTVAATVREGLNTAGFTTQKASGFAHKREMLIGQWQENISPVKLPQRRHAIILGAGLAGTHCAERLTARGWTIEIIERHSTLAQEASGNPSGIMQPILHMADTEQARLSRIAFLYAIRHIERLAANGHNIQWNGNGVLYVAPKNSDAMRLAQIIEQHAFPTELVRFIRADEASHLAGVAIVNDGYWFPRGAWAEPLSICRANLQQRHAQVVCHLNNKATRISKADDQWQVFDANNKIIAEAPVLILANAIDCKNFQYTAALPLKTVRGQVTYLPSFHDKQLNIGISGEGYITPMGQKGYCIGATFQRDDDNPALRVSDHAENLARLESLITGASTDISINDLDGRVAWRTTTPDRLPIFGELQPGLLVATGLGARGLIWAPLGAELLASKICGEPLPMEKELMNAVDPKRFG